MDGDSTLLRRMRQFWYNNEPGPFVFGENSITRKQIQVYGGPAPALDACPTCQAVEWLSRIRQQSLFRDHDCPANLKGRCMELCNRQGDELWTNYHQNFWYANGYSPGLNAPHACLYLNHKQKYERYWTPNCDSWMLDLRRGLAQIGTLETYRPGERIEWGRYDWVWMLAKGEYFDKRPPVPVVMFGHDVNHGNIQEMLDKEPDILVSSVPTAWRENFRIARRTKVMFSGSNAPSSFFTRPNLDDKKYDLLVIGATGHHLYRPRRELVKQVSPLIRKYTIGINERFGWPCCRYMGPVQYKAGSKTVNYLNKWSEFLSSSRYVIFAPTCGIAKEYVTRKTCEALGSGAVSIMPEVKDFGLLGIKPMVHYIPLSQVWNNNARLEQLLNSYDDHKHIARNAVRWHQQNVDRIVFDDFEEQIWELLGKRYPRRLI